ncbi:hypothetical protein HY640_01150 [Candidatus Woesearchaeota archaeon]|nr:hypothetical protein [Candidatus Woesearchaeota archaeon]
MATTIQISDRLLKTLKARKMQDSESYEAVIWDLIEDNLELSEETKRNIHQSERDIADGKTVSLNDIKKKIGLFC